MGHYDDCYEQEAAKKKAPKRRKKKLAEKTISKYGKEVVKAQVLREKVQCELKLELDHMYKSLNKLPKSFNKAPIANSLDLLKEMIHDVFEAHAYRSRFL